MALKACNINWCYAGDGGDLLAGADMTMVPNA